MTSYSLEEKKNIYDIVGQTIEIIKNIYPEYNVSYLYDDIRYNIPEIFVFEKLNIKNSVSMIPKTNNPETFARQLIAKLQKKKDYQSTYKNLSNVFSKIGIGCLYYTTYGFGFSTLYLKKSVIQEASDILDKYNIKYRTELSDANWIYRFVISQTIENIEKIKNIN